MKSEKKLGNLIVRQSDNKKSSEIIYVVKSPKGDPSGYIEMNTLDIQAIRSALMAVAGCLVLNGNLIEVTLKLP